MIGVDGAGDRALAEPEADTVTYGLAEFIAAEEMDRFRGYWWAPDGDRLFAARADEAPIQRWHIADPANPGRDAGGGALPGRRHGQRGGLRRGARPGRLARGRGVGGRARPT